MATSTKRSPETKVWLKACPKCHGDLKPGEDQYGPFWSCFQCGYLKDLKLAAA
jgi:DNA-directed RNA polymerase subunit M/transcription elongation factor TFIIS